MLAARSASLRLTGIRAVSLDITGTLLSTREPVVKSYHDAALWARLPDPPSQAEMKAAFKTAYYERNLESPCFGGVEGISGREWWRATVRRVLELCGRRYSDREFDRYFRRVFQHFGSPKGYVVLDDAAAFLADPPAGVLLGICSNTPTRHAESVLPMLGIHEQFAWCTCSQDVGVEKPAPEIFADAYEKARFWIPDLEKHEVLHVGDSLAADFCGARAFGFRALLLDRSENPSVTQYQTWLDAPDYPGKSEADIREGTITSLLDIELAGTGT